MSEIPVNPEILRWARESAGLTLEGVVSKINRKRVTIEVIQSWEEGTDYPNYKQLERLAYDIYKRPLAIFFFPEPPAESTPDHSFRTLPEQEIENLPPRIRYLLRKAKALQLNISELYEDINPSEQKIINDIRIQIDTPVTDIASQVREYLSVDLNQQFSFQDSEQAFKIWRENLEGKGVFIFKDAFKEDSYSGFCLYDQVFPVIYVNNSKPFTRQTFTLFHELAHLLFQTGGVDTNLDRYINYLSNDERRIEILCNEFAGEFLVPTNDFLNRSAGIDVDEESLLQFANTYKVSKEVVLRKFFDIGQINQHTYEAFVHTWARRPEPTRSPGGNYYLNMGVYLGEKYIDRAFRRYHQNYIGIEQLADYLGVKVRSIPGMEARLFEKGDAVYIKDIHNY